MMPQVDPAIADWRRQMAADGIHSAEVLEELECHLRDDIDAQMASGMNAADAFTSSVARLGPSHELTREFAKLGGAARGRIRTAWLTLAGIPHSYSSDTMNTMNPPSNLEPRSATYTKAAVFLSPALLLSVFSMMFLMPKLQVICREAGFTLPWVYHVTAFMADHPMLVLAALIAPFALLEWRWSRWPQFRRVSLGGTVFVLNAAVLVLLTLAMIFALSAAPNLNHG
jgi:hypothetical protein